MTEIITCFFFFGPASTYILYFIYCFVHVELSWPWCMIFKVCCCILFVGILLRTFASILIKEVGP